MGRFFPGHCRAAALAPALVTLALAGPAAARQAGAAAGPALVAGPPEAADPDAMGFDAVGGLLVPSRGPFDLRPEAGPAPARPRASRSTAPPPGAGPWDGLVREAAARHRVDPRLVACVIRQESGGRPDAVSRAGARGLMQLMPATARRFGVTDAVDPRQNVEAGTRYLRLLLDLFGGDLRLALAAYNAGEGRVIRAGYRVPPIAETRAYVRAILTRYLGAPARPRRTPGGGAAGVAPP
jgi:soluble lytic murein transglycosylase-like protein